MSTTLTPSSTAPADDLAARVNGTVYRPGTPGYAEEISGFNLATTHRPAYVVAASGAEDVAAAVRWAVENDLPVGVQATGHGAVTAVEGVLISTRRMQDFRVDPVDRTARIGAGVRWGAVLAAAARHGLAPPAGSSSDVGVVGYTLGGGLPALGRAFGFASDHVRSLEVVSAAGEILQVDSGHFPDLFWGLRGGKGNLGLVTSVTIDLPAAARLYGGGLFFPGERTGEVLRAWRDWALGLGEEASTSLAVLRLPPAPDIPEPLRGRHVVRVSYAHLGDPEVAERALAPMRGVSPAIVDLVEEMPYAQLDRIHQDPTHPLPAYERSLTLGGLDDGCVDAVIAGVGPDADTTTMMFELRLMGGALARPARTPDAVGIRDAAWTALAVGVLAPPIAERVPGDVDALMASLAPYGTGRTFVNFHGRPGDDVDRARPWPARTHRRLCELKKEYDPHNLFRFGHALSAG